MRTIRLFLLACLGLPVAAQNNALDLSYGDAELGYSTVLDFTGTDKFTIESWVKTTASYAAIIFSNHEDLLPFLGTEAAVVNGKAVLEVFNDFQYNGIRIETSNSVNDGEWHHLAFTYDGSQTAAGMKIYIDGILQSTSTQVNNLSSSTSSYNEFHMGSRDNTTYFSDIALDEMRIWKRNLCQSEIVARMTCTLTGTEPTLEAYYSFDQGIAGGNNPTVTVVIDQTGHGHDATITGLMLSGNTSNWVTGVTMSGPCGNYGNLALTGPAALCPNSQATISVASVSGATWMPGNLNGNPITVTPTAATIYTVMAFTSTTSNDPVSCLSKATYTLPVVPPFTLSVVAPTNAICRGSVISLSASGATSYTFSPNNIVASTATYVIQQNTIYTVSATNNSLCPAIQKTVAVQAKICEGINEQSRNNLSIYPNPVAGQLSFSSPLTDVQVFDISGKLVLFSGKTPSEHINVSTLPAGVYFLKGLLAEEPVLFKFIKE